MADLFTIENFGNLAVLIFLQAVLGFDNLLYISIESKRAPAAQQAAVRRNGIIIAVALRLVLLFTMIELIELMKDPFFVFNSPGIIEGGVNFSTIVFVFGGVFIMYTAFKEITHMLTIHDLEHEGERKSGKSALQVIILIVTMNLIFSFDSILSALAITDVFPILAFAIILSGLAMLVLPGQGILTLLAALALLDFPGRAWLEERLVRPRIVRRALNGLRAGVGAEGFRFTADEPTPRPAPTIWPAMEKT